MFPKSGRGEAGIYIRLRLPSDVHTVQSDIKEGKKNMKPTNRENGMIVPITGARLSSRDESLP